jgi:retinol dehydrogenase 12
MLFTLVLGLLVIIIIIIIAFTVAMTEILEMARVTLFGSRNSSKGAAFEPARDIPSLAGKVVLITGAAGDLGRNTAIQLARYGRPARIYVADLPRDDDAKTGLALRITHEAYGDVPADTNTKAAGPPTEIHYLNLDLSSLESVRECAADFVAQEQRLDILYLNAGIIRVAPGVTAEDYEIHFGINYLGHALLSRLLVPTMLRTIQQQPDVRIVIVSSEGHVIAPKGGIDFNKLKTNGADIVSSPPLVFWPNPKLFNKLTLPSPTQSVMGRVK